MTPPLIIGHRGSSAIAPENTLIAFERAMADGANGIEFDVRLAHDEVPVVIHDSDLKRTALRNGNVKELASTDLINIDAGSWFNKCYSDKANPGYTNEHIPTLAQTFDLMSNYKEALLYLEMKVEPGDEKRLATEVVKLIHSYSLIGQTIVESFNHSAIQQIKEIDSSIRTAALFERKLTQPIISARKIISQTTMCGADEVALQYTLVTPRTVDALHERGFKIVVWTVDKPSWLKRAIKLGIHALITNNPAGMIQNL
jgi:glycerophosphoryl diester phosphodiesterase